jgi:amphi-Trp domain-containing protein
MAEPERDIEKEVDRARFVDTLRRLADALEANQAFRIQVAQKRFTVPATAALQIEHEVDDGNEELALELKWRT